MKILSLSLAPFATLATCENIYIYIYMYIHEPLAVRLWQCAFGAPKGSAPMARYYDSQLHSSLRSLLARRAFDTPKDNGGDASIDIFLVASLEYHLI